MNIFKNLKIRTKLIGGFLLLAVTLGVASFLIPRGPFRQLSQTTIPFLAAASEINNLFDKIELEAFEYISTGEEGAAREVKEAGDELDVLLNQLENNLPNALAVEEVQELGESLEKMESISLGTIQSHSDTLALLERLETIENDLEPLVEDTPEFTLEELDEAVHELHEALQTLQIEAIEFVAVGRDSTEGEYDEVDLAPLLHSLNTLEPANATESDYIAALLNTASQMESVSDQVIGSHRRTVDLLENLEEMESKLSLTLSSMQIRAEESIGDQITQIGNNGQISSVIYVILALIIGLLISRGILGPIQKLSDTAQQISTGDLSVRADMDNYSRDEIGQLAQTFNQMTDQLQDAFDFAEQQNNQRIKQLETTAQISHQLTAMLDINSALQYVVTQIQQSFNYYHVHIYLQDDATGDLVMREGSGDIGQQLKADGHRLKPGQGIVGQVGSTGQPLLASNVDDFPDYVGNPLLPKTQAELALPIHKGTVVLGVLDIQSEVADSFTDEDLTLMQSIADQMAVVLDNARLFKEAHTVAAEAEALNRQLTLSTWSDISERVSADGYVFTRSGVAPVMSKATVNQDTWLPAMSEAVQTKKFVYDTGKADNGHEESGVLSVPLMLRDQVIGVIGIERSAPTDSGSGPNYTNRSSWTDDEVATIQAITEQIAQALDAARLANETQRAAWRDRVVSESTARVWATDEIEEVMRAAITQLGDQLQASEVVIRLGKEDDLLLEDHIGD